MHVLNPLKLLLIILTLAACAKDPVNIDDPKEYESADAELTDLLLSSANGKGLDYYQLPLSNDLGSIPTDPKNQLSYEKIELGKLLFHETGLGVKPKEQGSAGTYSCASCHHAAAGFQAGVKQGIGEGGSGFGLHGEGRVPDEDYGFDFLDIQPIRSPSVLNTSYQKVMLWNGQFGGTDINIGTEENWSIRSPKEVNFLGFEGLETQAIAGLTVHRMKVTDSLLIALGYMEMFDEAFPEVPQASRYNDTLAGLAIAAYERTVLANQAPFQDWLKGDLSAMTEDEKQGAIIFFGKGECVQCHTGPALNSMEFYALGMKEFSGEHISQTIAQDFFTSAQGRGGFTNKDEDLYKFKVPQLYNLKDSPFYGHGGSFTSIKDVIKYKNNGVSENSLVPDDQIYPGFVPKGLSDEEVEQLTLFIESALHDPALDRYVPETLPSGNCFPNSDPQSMLDLGCN